MPPQDRSLVLTFTHARRAIEPPSTLSLKLATLPAPDQWGVWVRRASVVLSACPMAGRMFSSTAPLYEPTASDFHEFSPSFVSEYVDNFKRETGVIMLSGGEKGSARGLPTRAKKPPSPNPLLLDLWGPCVSVSVCHAPPSR